MEKTDQKPSIFAQMVGSLKYTNFTHCVCKKKSKKWSKIINFHKNYKKIVIKIYKYHIKT